LARRALAELLGTGLLVTAVVGSGIAAARLSPGDVGLQLFENVVATAFALGVLILVFGAVSGAHFNPVVSLVDWWVGRREGTGLRPAELGAYVGAQVAGAIGGAVLANLMFDLAAVSWSTTNRAAGHLWLGEVVATAGLILLVFAFGSLRPCPGGSGRGGRLHRRRLLVHQLDQLRHYLDTIVDQASRPVSFGLVSGAIVTRRGCVCEYDARWRPAARPWWNYLGRTARR
jgi:glycerol uptake facilitator-like aquaporin